MSGIDGSGMTINNNIVNSNQTDNSKSETKINQGKSVRHHSIPQQYLYVNIKKRGVNHDPSRTY